MEKKNIRGYQGMGEVDGNGEQLVKFNFLLQF
jgi:hypothetical protein